MPSSPASRTSLAVLLLLCMSFAAQAAEATPEAFLATHNTEGVRLNRTAMGKSLLLRRVSPENCGNDVEQRFR